MSFKLKIKSSLMMCSNIEISMSIIQIVKFYNVMTFLGLLEQLISIVSLNKYQTCKPEI